MNFTEGPLAQANEIELDYEKFLKIRRVDIDTDLRKAMLKFSIDDSYNIFVTSQSHEHLYLVPGFDSRRETLTEGYIFFDEDGAMENIQFKMDGYQKIPAFNGNSQQLAQLKKAASDLLEKSFGKK